MTFVVLIKNGRSAIGIALCTLLMMQGGHAENMSTVFVSTETPPYWSASLPDQGLGGRILKLVSEAAGIKYSIEYLPLKRFENSPGRHLVGDPDIPLKKGNSAIFPIGIFRTSFFYYTPHHPAINFKALRTLRGYKMGVLRGALENKSAFLNAGLVVEECDSTESLIRMLQRGRLDFAIAVKDTGKYVIKKEFPGEINLFNEVEIASMQRPITIMIDTQTSEGKNLALRYQQVLRKVLRSRGYIQIMEKFYAESDMSTMQFKQVDKLIKQYEHTWKLATTGERNESRQ